jgi:hypothetical protein
MCKLCGQASCSCKYFRTYTSCSPEPVRQTRNTLPLVNKRRKVPPYLVTVLSISGGMAGLAGIMLFLFVPHKATAQVVETSWVYKATLEERHTYHGSGWGSPFGSFNVSCQSKYYGDESCHPHNCRPHSVSYSCNCTSYECSCRTTCSSNKNGFSTCTERCSTCSKCQTCSRTEYDTCYDSCPVYRDYCSYDYYKWDEINHETTQGSWDQKPAWGTLQATTSTQRLQKSESYTVKMKLSDITVETYHPSSMSDYLKYTYGQYWNIRVNKVGHIWVDGPRNDKATSF